MNRTDSTDTMGSTKMSRSSMSSKMDKLEQAEQKVTDNIERFERAMEDLADKVEVSGQRAQHAFDLARKSKEDLARMKDAAISAVQPVGDYARKALGRSRGTASRVRRNPRPYLLSAIGIFGGLLLINFFRDRSSSRRSYSDMPADRSVETSAGRSGTAATSGSAMDQPISPSFADADARTNTAYPEPPTMS